MQISQSVRDGTRFYEVVLSRRDFDDLCSGCPDGGFIAGRHDDVYFHIFEGIGFPEAWRRMDEGYFMNVGVTAPMPAPGNN